MINWEEIYEKGEVFWNKGAPSPPMMQYLERHTVRGRAGAGLVRSRNCFARGLQG